jgi:hypothetical protein
LPAFKNARLDLDIIAAIVAAAVGGQPQSAGERAPLDAAANYSIETVLERFLPISRSKLYALIRGGKLVKIRIGGRALITGASLVAYLSNPSRPPEKASCAAPEHDLADVFGEHVA